MPEAGGGVWTGQGARESPADEFGDFLLDLSRELESALEGQALENDGEVRSDARVEGTRLDLAVLFDPARVALDWVGAAGRLRLRQGAG